MMNMSHDDFAVKPVSAVEWALKLASLGFLIFPLRPGSKEPFEGQSWKALMTSDPETIGRWFTEDPGINYGVCAGPDHVIIDLDIKPTIDGETAFLELACEAEDLDTPLSFRVRTPSGGCHLYLSIPHPVSNAHRLPHGIDVRGAGGYVVGPGCRLVRGKCKAKDTPGHYVAEDSEAPVLPAPAWILEKLRRPSERDPDRTDFHGELDDEGAVARAMEWLRHREPAVEGSGGDEHTLITCMGVMDFGVSREKTVEILTTPFRLDGESEPQSWNERCSPPWTVHGRKGTLEEKVHNAWRYRTNEVGSKGGGSGEDQFDGLEFGDDEGVGGDESEPPENRWPKLAHRGGDVLTKIRPAETVIAEWIPADGATGLLARWGAGKTVVLLDMALTLASGGRWCDQPTKSGFYAVYLCGEDVANTAGHVEAWCRMRGLTEPPERFIFVEDTPDLMSAEDCRALAEFLNGLLPDGARAVLFVDTWQRASSKGGQNKDEDMQRCIDHAEAVARSLNGPAVVAFHPPKAGGDTIMGSSVMENALAAILILEDQSGTRNLRVQKMKNRGTGNRQTFRIETVGLGRTEEHGGEVTGAVAVRLGGVEAVAHREHEREAYASAIREAMTRDRDESSDPADWVREWTIKATADRIGGRTIVIDGEEVSAMSAKRLRQADGLASMFARPHPLGDGNELALVDTGRNRGRGVERAFKIRRDRAAESLTGGTSLTGDADGDP